MENEQLNFKFEYTDEFGQTTKFEQGISVDILEYYNGNLELMVDKFKQFLYACGYSDNLVQQVQIVEERHIE